MISPTSVTDFRRRTHTHKFNFAFESILLRISLCVQSTIENDVYLSVISKCVCARSSHRPSPAHLPLSHFLYRTCLSDYSRPLNCNWKLAEMKTLSTFDSQLDYSRTTFDSESSANLLISWLAVSSAWAGCSHRYVWNRRFSLFIQNRQRRVKVKMVHINSNLVQL